MPSSIAEKREIHKLVNDVAKGIYGDSLLTYQARKILSGTRDNLDRGVLTPLITEALSNTDGTSRINSLDPDQLVQLVQNLVTACKDYQRKTHVQLSTSKITIDTNLTVKMEERGVAQNSSAGILVVPQASGSLQLVRAAAPSAPKTPFSVGDIIIYHLMPFLKPKALLSLGPANTKLFKFVRYFQKYGSFVPQSMLDIAERYYLTTAIAGIERLPSIKKLAKYESLSPPSFQELDLSQLRSDRDNITDSDIIKLISERPHLTSLNSCSEFTQTSLEFIAKNCPNLKTLDLSGTTVSDVSALAACTQLKTLDLSGTTVSDVSALAACTQLKTLDLTWTKVSDVSALAACTQLETLRLRGTPVSDVSALKACTQLRTLDLRDTPVSNEAIQKLYASHPNKDLVIYNRNGLVKRVETAKPAGFFVNMEKERSDAAWVR